MKRKIIHLVITAAIAAPIACISLFQLRAAQKPPVGCFSPCGSDEDCFKIPAPKCPVCGGNGCQDVH